MQYQKKNPPPEAPKFDQDLHTNLLVDLNNVVFSTRFAKVKTPARGIKEPLVANYVMKEVIQTIVFHANLFNVDAIAITCDSPNVWRKDVFPTYKGNRDKSDIYHDECIEAAGLIKEFFSTVTNSSVLESPRAEADDIIAVFCQESTGVNNIIMSADKDFIQLTDVNTKLYSPTQKTWRTSEDTSFDLFLKCIRGDTNDNIRSAFPKVRETRLRKAWDDPVEMINLMETVRKDGVKVNEAFEMNLKLIGLNEQPPHIRDEIRDMIFLELAKRKCYGELKIMKFFHDNELAEHKDMLVYKERPLRGSVVFQA